MFNLDILNSLLSKQYKIIVLCILFYFDKKIKKTFQPVRPKVGFRELFHLYETDET